MDFWQIFWITEATIFGFAIVCCLVWAFVTGRICAKKTEDGHQQYLAVGIND